MTDWSSGYVSEIDYTYGYYPELNPVHVRLALLHAGLAPPTIEEACELGFGQGLSLNIHAAATATRWHGTDFNPAQAAHARALAAASGADARLFDDAFADFAQRSDLPEFDYIALHGIWSWISDDNRRVIGDFVRRRLKPGGVLYVSYNTQPGWAGMVPMRQLLSGYARVLAAPGQGIAARIDGALAFADRLVAASPAFARANPAVPERLKKMKEQGRNYLAHEYFNRDWRPMDVAEMGECLALAKLTYACSAGYLEHIPVLHLTAEQQALLKEVPDPLFREMVRDFLVNQQFRRDYWVKGARRLTPPEQVAEVQKQQLLLLTPAADVSLKVTGALGEASLQEAVYRPLLELMADRAPRTIGDIERALKPKGISLGQVVSATLILIGKGDMAPVQDKERQLRAKGAAARLNHSLIERALASNHINFLASPVTGGAAAAGRFQQLFLLAAASGRKAPEDWARATMGVLTAQGQSIVKDGKTIEGADNALAELNSQARDFADKRLPVLKALMVA